MVRTKASYGLSVIFNHSNLGDQHLPGLEKATVGEVAAQRRGAGGTGSLLWKITASGNIPPGRLPARKLGSVRAGSMNSR
jgi:hypothetical protein